MASEEQIDEEMEFLEDVLDGESHSPAETEGNSGTGGTETEENGNELIPEDEGEEEELFPESDDSVSKKPEETAPGPDESALKQEIEGLQKRLHDTQSAFHKATGERAALQKELEELKAKQASEDDWFSEDDRERVSKLEEDLKKSDAEIERVQQEEKDLRAQNANARWDAAAAPVIKAHPDFEKVMYDQFVPLLDPKTGNPQIRAAWEALEDKSPASQYEFAKQQLDILEFQRDPKAYKERLLKESGNTNRNRENPYRPFDGAPTGKEALDMLNSENGSGETFEPDSTDFVEAVFG